VMPVIKARFLIRVRSLFGSRVLMGNCRCGQRRRGGLLERDDVLVLDPRGES
jgi:hypothetical protein